MRGLGPFNLVTGIGVTPLAQVATLMAILVVGAIVDGVVVNRRSVR